MAYISMMGHLCTNIKVPFLHNLMKKQSLIPINATLFCCDWICTWITFWIYIININVVKKIILFSHFDFVHHTSYEIIFLMILCFPPSVKIITNCLMSNFLIGLFFSFGLIDCVEKFMKLPTQKQTYSLYFNW